MKNKKKYKIILLILTILVILIIMLSKLKFNFIQDDILFLKFLGDAFKSEQIPNEMQSINYNEKSENIKAQYIFNITYKNMNFANVNLTDTINSKKLVNEKIAPGISGSFDIVIKTNKDSEYQIYFISKNEKPQNLEFKIANTNIYSNKIEDLSKYLKGYLKKGESKVVTIEWNWNYENEEKGDIQDTKDSQNIDKYIFDIYTYGEQSTN